MVIKRNNINGFSVPDQDEDFRVGIITGADLKANKPIFQGELPNRDFIMGFKLEATDPDAIVQTKMIEYFENTDQVLHERYISVVSNSSNGQIVTGEFEKLAHACISVRSRLVKIYAVLPDDTKIADTDKLYYSIATTKLTTPNYAGRELIAATSNFKLIHLTDISEKERIFTFSYDVQTLPINNPDIQNCAIFFDITNELKRYERHYIEGLAIAQPSSTPGHLHNFIANTLPEDNNQAEAIITRDITAEPYGHIYEGFALDRTTDTKGGIINFNSLYYTVERDSNSHTCYFKIISIRE